MFILMFAAIGGGLATLSVLAPFGGLVAAACAPIGGSLCAVVAAAYVTRHSSEADHRVDLDLQADAMVASLRELTARSVETASTPMATGTEEATRQARAS